jgi:hypothetical protein
MILPEHLNWDTVKHANGRHAKIPSWPQSITHHRGFLTIKLPLGCHDDNLGAMDVLKNGRLGEDNVRSAHS